MCKKLTKAEIQDISDKNFGSITFIQRGKNTRYGFFFCSKHQTTSRQYLNSHYKGFNPCKVCRKIAGRPRRNSISDINQRLGDKFDGVIEFHSYHPENKRKAYFKCSIHGKTGEKYMGNVLHSNQKNNPCNQCQNEQIFEPNNKLTIADINNRLLKSSIKLAIIRRKTSDSRLGIFRCSVHGHIKKALNISSVFISKAECPKCKANRLPPPNKFSRTEIQKLSDEVFGNFIFLGRSKTDFKLGLFICKDHIEKGVQEQFISNHIRGSNPCCGKISKGEKRIAAYLVNEGYKFSQNKSFEECRNIYPLPFDFFIPDLNLLIEFDGEQHYRPVERFGGNKKHIKIKMRDEIKTSFVKKRNFNFLRIPYSHVGKINTILKSNIALIERGKHILNEIKVA